MDPADQHPEPFGEAFSYSSQRAAQMISLVAAATEVAVHHMARHKAQQAARDEQADRALQEQERTAHKQARAQWAPAHDRRWLPQADLFQVARTWGAAAPYAGTEPEAASGMRKCEERLRTLHPYAMGRYDRLRSEGASPLNAMREAAPLFGREPHARPGQPGTRRLIETGPSTLGPVSEAPTGNDSLTEPQPGQDANQEAEDRGRRIAQQLQADAQAERGLELSLDELATALEERTNLPTEVIWRIARADNEEQVAAGAEHARSAELGQAADMTAAHALDEHMAEDLQAAARHATTIADTASAHASADRAVARLAAESFPCTAVDGIRASINGSLRQPVQSEPYARKVESLSLYS